MACPACLVAFAGTDGLPSGAVGSYAPLGQAPAQPPPPSAGLSALWPFLGGAVLAYFAVRVLLPDPGGR